MSDTMRDAPEPMKIEPGSDMHLTVLMAPDSLNLVVGEDRAALLRYAKRVWQAAQSQPAPPVPASVQEIMPLVNAYVRACGEFLISGEDGAEEALKPLQATLTALVDENHRLKFELAGVNAMRRPLTAEQIRAVMESVDFTYEPTRFARAIEKAHGIEPEQGEVK